MTTVIVQQQHSLRHSTPPPTSPMAPSLAVNAVPRQSPVSRHLPVCPAGPSPESSPESSSSPFSYHSSDSQDSAKPSSLLISPDQSTRLTPASSPIFAIDAETLSAALNHQASLPLPDPEQMFPWIHGLHPDNHLQLGFFLGRKRGHRVRRTPKCWRGITLVKLGGDLRKARINGAVGPDEVISIRDRFMVADGLLEGFSVRNFDIQTSKMATLSDIVIYGEDSVQQSELIKLAERFGVAQKAWQNKYDPLHEHPPYNCFVLTSSFTDFEKKFPHLVAVNSMGETTGQVTDFGQCEKFEMRSMAKASEISKNVWLGPTPDWMLKSGGEASKEVTYDLMIETNDLSSIPGPRYLSMIDKKLEDGPQRMDFPSSGAIVLPSEKSENNREVQDLISTLRWIYYLANPDEPAEAQEKDSGMGLSISHSELKPRKVLIHCPDGYTESSLLAVAYFMFAQNVPVHEAWMRLHCEKKRNFFAYPIDMQLLKLVQPRILQESPAPITSNSTHIWEPSWFGTVDGSLPSRIMPYLYLGNINHANNPEMLWELGIRQVLSVGEPLNWSKEERAVWGQESLLYIDDVQDNGIDPLSPEFARCLKFIENCKHDGSATLVHCRVGVSRSATICIAEVMQAMSLSFARAYYELLQWEELQMRKRKIPLKRELEWASVCHEIALLNKPYART
ncbi:hypothetical protein N7495_005247 [Penicillium taxi]|uniref:uncharacterized protein n=1 Tax=Penicillium taxi TaxID=168475 RepID=UPI002545A59B|nr:uncharacterized protein N7495_005247 [Penicillium taxi]KAJ5893556.1 hypothetical protein N7495_005247 [Penicillium taxi]